MGKQLAILAAESKGESVAAAMGHYSFPIDPLAVAADRGITVAERDLSGCMGCLMKVGDNFGILHAAGLRNEGVIRFTIAHELGHYFLEGHAEHLFPAGDGQHFSQSGFVSSDPHEREADAFAVGLLLPETLFRKQVRDSGVGFSAIQKLSSHCSTSLTATAIRYATFAEDPVAVIVSNGPKVDFCFMSESLKESRRFDWLKKGDLIPTGTTTADFNRDTENIRGGKTAEGYSNLAAWFDGAPDVEMMEDVVGLGRYGRTLTVLFTEEPLDEGEDSHDED
ncbi:MAG: ImmA/IrrE family metallo-endopeptidase [Planctomycetes bacterium]|nr:ImmA/IrrE family metallo-endopeptidase [Planctomycetota bacterium]